jgi:hypothetical protein
VSWNKPFKERIRHSYQLWMLNGDRREYTPAGNPKAPSLEVVLEWAQRAWDELSKEVIVKSFEGGFSAAFPLPSTHSFPSFFSLRPHHPLRMDLATTRSRASKRAVRLAFAG